MQINRGLKLVIPVYSGDELLLNVHAEPLSRLAFEANYKIMARAWSDLNAAGIGSIGLMTTASFALKEAALGLYGKEDGGDGTPGGLSRYTSFMAEMLRTATAIIPNSGSWAPAPYENAKAAGLLTEDDSAIVESLIAFFILASRMVDPHWGQILRTAIQLNYSAQFISLGSMEYITSLQTLTPDANSGKKTT